MKNKNYLVARDTALQLSEQRNYWQNKVEALFLESFLSLMEKVTPLPSGEAKEFWETHLLNMMPLLKRHQKVVYDFQQLEQEYNSLYKKYDEMVSLNLKLKEEFTRV